MCLTKHEVIKHGRDLNEEPQDDKDTTYEKKWISYDKSNSETTWEVISDGKARTLTYVGVNPITNIELDRLIADTVAGEDGLDTSSESEDVPTYLCTSCNIVFQDKTVLDWHVNKHDLEDSFRLMASSKDNYIPEVSAEMSALMKRKYLTCSECGYPDEQKQSLVLHMLLDHYDCEISGIISTNVKGYDDKAADDEKILKDGSDFVKCLKEKLTRRISQTMLSCGTCDFMTSSRTLFMTHRQECSGSGEYVVPCEIVISEDLNYINNENSQDIVPVDVINPFNGHNAIKVKTKIVKGVKQRRSDGTENSPFKIKQYRRKRHSKNYVSDDEDDPDEIRKPLQCPECIFKCERKRVMALHYLNVHINQLPKTLRFDQLKDALSEKLGVKPLDSIYDDLDEDSEIVDDPDESETSSIFFTPPKKLKPLSWPKITKASKYKSKMEIDESLDVEKNLRELVGDPLPDSPSLTVVKEETNDITIIKQQLEGVDSETEPDGIDLTDVLRNVKQDLINDLSSSSDEKSNRTCSNEVIKICDGGASNRTDLPAHPVSNHKIELLEKLDLKLSSKINEMKKSPLDAETVASDKQSTSSCISDVPLRKSSRSNAGQNPKGLLSVKDIRLLMYGKTKSPEWSASTSFAKNNSSKTQRASKESKRPLKVNRVSNKIINETKLSSVKKTELNYKELDKNKGKSSNLSFSKHKQSFQITPFKENLQKNKPAPVKLLHEVEEGGSDSFVGVGKESAIKVEVPICEKCDAKMCSWEALNMHTILAHGFSILLTCSYCCFTTTDKTLLRRHINRCFLLNS